jgi:Tfp pilus assembly protein PilF
MKSQAYRTSAFCLILSLAVSVLCFVTSSAQNPPGGGGNPNAPGRGGGAVSHTIRGKIFLPSGNLPEQRIRVVLELNTGGIANETFSDSVGNFEFRSLPSNSYRVTVPTDNRTYETTQEVVELYGNFPRTFMVQIYLKDKGSDPIFKTKEKILSVADMQEVPKNAKKAYEKGLKLAQENKREEAIARFDEAIKTYPEYLNALNKMGEQYMATNKWTEAQASFERAIAVNPKFALPHINLGIVHVSQQRFAEAISEFESGNRFDDTYPMSHLYLGVALMSTAPPDFDRSEKELTRALALGGRNFAHVHKHLFNLNIKRRDLNKAAENLEAYLKAQPDAQDAEQVRQMLSKVKNAIAQQKEPTKP